MIKLKNINKSYSIGKNKLHVLKGIDLEVEKGEFVSIMGSSGSGKSTLLNIIGILDSYDEGDYYLNGTIIKDIKETRAAHLRNKYIGFVFQSFNLISFKNAMENVANNKIVLFTPNGFVPQTDDKNPWNRHRSGWTAEEMKRRGYRVIGMNGLKHLKGEYATPKYKPKLLWYMISEITQLLKMV